MIHWGGETTLLEEKKNVQQNTQRITGTNGLKKGSTNAINTLTVGQVRSNVIELGRMFWAKKNSDGRGKIKREKSLFTLNY